MIRPRDVLAAIGVLWLSSSAWNEQSIANSISASIQLAFYLPSSSPTSRSSHLIPPTVLDVDGDGTPEALVAWTQKEEEKSFTLQVLDLRPMSQRRQQSAPFQPKILLESESFPATSRDDGDADRPLKMITGQVLTNDVVKQPKKEHAQSSEGGDRTLRYFCGSDWHDASERCAVHCPSGQSTDCPSGERCFADTPCLAGIDGKKLDETSPVFGMMDSLHTTPAGGWPSVFTVWKDSITMHSLTAEQPSDATDSTKKQRRKQQKPTLEVKQMWHVSPLQPHNKTTVEVEYEDVDVVFLDALSAPADHGSNAGMLIVSGTAVVHVFKPDRDDDKSIDEDGDDEFLGTNWETFVLALDALTGETVWQSYSSNVLDKVLGDPKEKIPLPVASSSSRSTSVARRRSLIPGLQSSDANKGTSVANCLREYRTSLLTSSALPYQFWTYDDTKVAAMHFDHQPRSTSKNRKGVKPHSTAAARRTAQSSPSWLSSIFSREKKRTKPLHYGRPNVIVTHNYEGIHVRSLKNGRSLCHLSLQDETLYADINHDGTLDNLQIVTSHPEALVGGEDDEVVAERKWVQQLAEKVTNSENKVIKPKKKNKKFSKQKAGKELAQPRLCHLLALSGLPTKEELFSTSLCYPNKRGDDSAAAAAAQQQPSIQGAPLLVAEPTSRGGRRAQNHRGHDILAAVNSGFVTRVRGNTGRRLWKVNGNRLYGSDFPTWDDPAAVVFERVDSLQVIPSMRPIVLAGENSVALLSAASGRLLGSIATFPQPSRTRPRLIDLDGDGTLDLLVSTTDAVWGYHIVVTTGASILFRIIVGLLIMGLMLAFLRNRFGPHPGKRSTDL